jgi:predicted nucleic acid-binding Zn ribbon protein
MPDVISLGEALKRFLDKSRIKPAIQSMQIEDHWEKVMGSTIAKFTDRIEIRNGTLFIYTQMAPLKNELVFQRDLIIKRINESMNETIVREVVVV